MQQSSPSLRGLSGDLFAFVIEAAASRAVAAWGVAIIGVALLGGGLGCKEESSGVVPSDSSGQDAQQDGAGPDGSQDATEDAAVILELQPTWRYLDLGEDTEYQAVHVFGLGANAQYALVGTNGVVALYNGDTPRFLNLGMAVDLNAVWAGSEDTLIVAGKGGILRHWDSTLHTWTAPNGLPPSGVTSYTALFGSGPDNVFVGAADGGLWRYVGGQWVSVIDSTGQNPTQGKAVSDIWVSSEGVAFIAAGQHLIWGQASEWQRFEAGRPPRAIWGFGAANVVAVTMPGAGSGEFIYRFGTSGWSETPANAAAALQGLNDVWGPQSTNVLATGFKGTLIRYTERDEQALDWGLVRTGDKELYSVYSPPDTPAGLKLTASSLTLRRLSGFNAEEMLMIVDGLTITPEEGGEAVSMKGALLEFRKHPVRLPE